MAKETTAVAGEFSFEARNLVSLSVEDAGIGTAGCADGGSPGRGERNVGCQHGIGAQLTILHDSGKRSQLVGIADVVELSTINLCSGQALRPSLRSSQSQ